MNNTKKRIILCICCICLCAIAIISICNSNIIENKKEQDVTNINTSNIDTLNIKAVYFEFNHHKYIIFTLKDKSWCVHDPNCICYD